VFPVTPRPLVVHEKLVPITELVSAKLQLTPEHRVCAIGADVTIGVGLTAIVYTVGGPVQPANVAVILIVPTIEVEPELVAVYGGISPTPLPEIPMEGFEFVQLNVAPGGVLVKFVAASVAPLQEDGLNNASTVGNGLTVIVRVDVATVSAASVT